MATVALLEKHAKTRLAVAADHFNRDYKKGFQFLQVWHRCCSFFLQSCTACLKARQERGLLCCLAEKGLLTGTTSNVECANGTSG